MLSLVLAQAATVAPDQLPPWLTLLQGPILGGFIVAILTQALKAIPAIPVAKGPKVAAVAGVLSVIAGLITAYASGDLSGFDANSAWTAIMYAVVTFTSATGAHEVKTHADALFTTRSKEGAASPPTNNPVPDAL